MARLWMMAALAPLALAAFGPAHAQRADNVLIVYGNDPCPRSKGGDEIVVCARKPESERYRIPQALRGNVGAANAERWGDRAQSLEYVGASGVQSCSPVGPGGATGCFSRLMKDARRERNAKAAEDAAYVPN